MRPTNATIIRTIVNIIAALNAVLTMTGKPLIPIKDETVEIVVNAAVSIVVWTHGFWKNNSYTEAAIEGDQLKNRLKNAEV